MSGENAVDRNPLADAIEARLRAEVANAEGYLGEPSQVPLKENSDQRVAPYWVLHTSAGRPSGEDDLADTAVDLVQTFQINCAGDSEYDVRALVTKVDAAMYRWIPVVTGHQFGRIKPPFGFDPGPIRLDKTEKPHRYVVALQYVLPVTVT